MSIKLDNASNIYTASLCKQYASLYRLSVTLTETVNVNHLQQALVNTVRRMPNFGCRIHNGAFWWYLRDMDRLPEVSEPDSLSKTDHRLGSGFLFKVFADDNKIVLDVFHALADGTGSQTFLITLTSEYLKLYNNVRIRERNSLILNTREDYRESEIEDSFTLFGNKKGSLEVNDAAYHIKGTKEAYHVLHNERVVLKASQTSAVAKKLGCTVTELCTAAMLSAAQELRLQDKSKRAKTALKISVPVNLRNFFKGSTLRNFSSYVNLGIDIKNGTYSFEEILQTVIEQKKLLVTIPELENKVAANVELENSFIVKAIPLFLKRPVIDYVCRTRGEKFNTHTFSNLGRVNLPESMSRYISSMDFILGRQRECSGAAACVCYGDDIVINFSRNIAENEFECAFCRQMSALGIDSTMRSEELGC